MDIRKTTGDSSWFVRDRFGLFIHWGLYAQAARHEWVMDREKIPPEVYRKRYFKRFDPDLYDPARWADAAANAGMKYFVVTTKHHEGFCLWDSKYTDFKAPNTAAGRDLLWPMVEAFRARDFRVGFYHSLLDWSHPDYVHDAHYGPHKGKSPEELAAINAGRDMRRYAQYLYNQTEELLTQFGPIDILWYDFSYRKGDAAVKGREQWQSEKLIELIRRLQPKVLLDNRLDLDRPDAWDFSTPEQTQPREWVTVNGQRVVWEACQTLSGSWGYFRDQHTWRSTDQLVRTLIDCVSKGGNLLLNVGPTGRGEFDQRALDRLEGIGKWMHHHARSIYGCTEAPPEFVAPPDCRLTWNPDTQRLYLHLFAYPYQYLTLDGPAIAERFEYAQFLHDASEIATGVAAWQEHMVGKRTGVTFNIPAPAPNVTVPVIEIFLKH